MPLTFRNPFGQGFNQPQPIEATPTAARPLRARLQPRRPRFGAMLTSESFSTNLRLFIVVCTLCSILPFGVLQNAVYTNSGSGVNSQIAPIGTGRGPGLDIPPAPRLGGGTFPQLPPGISSYRAYLNSENALTLVWKTDAQAYSFQLTYGATEALGQFQRDLAVNSEQQADGSYLHQLTVTNPAANGTQPFYYRLEATLANNGSSSFMTAIRSIGAQPDPSLPVFSASAANTVAEVGSFSADTPSPSSAESTKQSAITAFSVKAVTTPPDGFGLTNTGSNGSFDLRSVSTAAAPGGFISLSPFGGSGPTFDPDGPLSRNIPSDNTCYIITGNQYPHFDNDYFQGVWLGAVENKGVAVIVPSNFGTYFYQPGHQVSPREGNSFTAPLYNLRASSISQDTNGNLSFGSGDFSFDASGAIMAIPLDFTQAPASLKNNSVFSSQCGKSRSKAPLSCPFNCGHDNTPGLTGDWANVTNAGAKGDPISMKDGSFQERFRLMSLGGVGLPIDIFLNYTTKNWFNGLGTNAFGRGWTMAYTRRLVNVPSQDWCTGNVCVATVKVMRLQRENGDSYTYPVSANSFEVSSAAGTLFTSLSYDPATEKYTLLYPSGFRDTFDKNGYLIQVADQHGNATDISFANNIYKLTNNRTGQALIVNTQPQTDPDYGNVPRIVSIQDAPGNGGLQRTVSFAYGTSGNDNARLISVADSNGNTYSFSYDAAGRIEKVYDPNNIPGTPGAKFAQNSYFTYPITNTPQIASPVVTRQVLPNGTTLDFSYGIFSGGITAKIFYNKDKPADQQRFEFVGYENGQLKNVFNPNSETATYNFFYDANTGLLSSANGPDGKRVVYQYDPILGAPTSISDNSNSYRMTYDTNPNSKSYGSLLTLSEPVNTTSTPNIRFQYDPTTGFLQQAIRTAQITINGVQQPITQTTTYQTNTYGQVTQVTLPDGTIMKQEYDLNPDGTAGNGKLGYPTVATYDYGTTTGKLNITSRTAFDANGRLTSYTDERGITSRYEYFSNGWIKSAFFDTTGSSARNIQTDYTYDKVGNLVKIIEDVGSNRKNITTLMDYDYAGTEGGYAVISMTNALNQISRMTYTPFGEVKTMVDPSNRITSFGFEFTNNSLGVFTTTITLPGGQSATNVYNRQGTLKYTLDPRGVRNEYEYDSMYRLKYAKLGMVDVNGSPAIKALYEYQYDRNSRLTLVNEPVGAGPNFTGRTMLRYEYDGFGRLSRTIVGDPNTPANERLITTYSYDDLPFNGQPATLRNFLRLVTIGSNVPAEQVQTSYNYDALGRPTQVIQDPGTGRSNLTSQYSYDIGTGDKWSLQQVQDPRGNLTKYAYNSFGLLAATTDANNQTWSYDYNNQGLLTTIQDPLSVNGSRDTSYFYDLLGRTITTTRGGKSESWNYNPDGTLARYTGIGGNYAVLGYNDNLELTSRNYFKANGTADPSASASFQYYPNGLLKTVTDNGGGAANTTTYSYDAANRLISRSRPGFNGAPLAISYEYNLNNTLKNLNYWGTHGKVSYEYDGANRVSTFKPTWGNANQAANTYTYRSTGALSAANRPSTVGVNTNYGYDTATRNTGITNGTNGNRPSLQYGGLDGNNNPAVVTATQSLAGLNAVTSYNFDKLDRLTRSLYPGGAYANTGVNYGYDAVGNLTSVSPDNAGKLNTIAGTQDAAGYTGDGGNATAATLRSPRGIAVGPDGAVYIADSLNRVVRRISPSGVITTVAGNGAATPYTAADEGKPATSVSLINPIAITVGAGGRLLIADEGNSTVRAVTFDPATGQGTITLIAGTGTAGAYTDGTSQENVSATSVPLNGPSGVAIGTNGMIYISDRDNHIVRKVNQTGKISTVLGTPGQAGFGGDGQSQTVGTTKLSSPQRLVLNADGYLYVADLGNNRLRYVTFDGSDVGSWGNGFNRPVGVAAAPDGSIYVGDLNNQRVARVAPDGTTTTVAGTGTSGSSADGGNATATTLRNPTDVAIGPDGVLLIVEPGTQRIRSVGIATTYSHNTLDQLEGYTYDASGNLTREPNGTVYVYNAANQLIQTIKGDGYTTYKYDGLGNLIQQAQSLAGNVTDLVWEEGSGQLLGEVYYNRVSGAVRDEYLYGYGPEGFAAQLHKNSSGSNLQYPLTDRIGSVMQLLNTNGQVVNSYTYNAFGTVRQQSMGENTTLRFAGARANPDGTIYLGSRVYQPQLGKFLQRDSYDGSVGDGQSQNRYSYVQNNPVNYVDPSGYSRELPSTAAGANAAVSYSYRSANLGIGSSSELSLAGANANNSVATSAAAGLGGVSSSSSSNSSNSGVATAAAGATVGFGVGTGSTIPSAPSSNPNNSVPFSAPTPCRLRKQEEQEESAAIFGGDDDGEDMLEYWSVLPAYKWRRLRTVKFYR
jgi:RHS repeat-associated protein